MNINEFQIINGLRAKRWHNEGKTEWTLLEWAGAMAGETGEACNVAKKIRRLDQALPNKEAGLDKSDKEALYKKLAEEIADSMIYGLIILEKIRYQAGPLLADVFDKKSEEYGFPERAPRPHETSSR